MIISCPECAGPFEVPDDRIAALVQVACPHCAFRMILDFAAANDPGLVEEGMRMASGFRSAADYHASVQLAAQPGEAVAVEAEPVQVAAEATTGEAAAEAAPRPTEPPVRVQPRATEPPVRVQPRTEPPVRARPEPVSPASPPPRPLASTPSREPERPAAEARPPVSEEARTEVHMLPRDGEKLVPVDIPPVGRAPVQRSDEDEIAVSVPEPATEIVRTVVGHPPPPPNADEIAVDIDDDDEREPAAARPQAQATASAEDEAAHPAFGSDEDEDVPTMVVSPEAREAARREMEELAAARQARPEPEPEPEAAPSSRERPRPPHTPPSRAKVATRDEEAVTVASSDRLRRAEASEDAETTGRRPSAVDEGTSAEADEDELEAERMSTFGVVVVVVLLLLAIGLVGASVALNEDHSPDPRPLLEKLYRQHVKGEPAAKAEPAAK